MDSHNRLPARVLVLGCPGSGKSMLSRQLAQITGLPLYHLDDYYWEEEWKRPDPIKWRTTLESLISREEWILDGNYQATLPVRLARATAVVLLDFPAWLCLYRVALRGAARFLGETNSLPRRVRRHGAGRLTLDPRFVVKVVLFRARQLPFLLRMIFDSRAESDVYALRSSTDVARFLFRISGYCRSEKDASTTSVPD